MYMPLHASSPAILMHTHLLEEGTAVEYSCLHHAPSSQRRRQLGLQAPRAGIHSDQGQVPPARVGVHRQNLSLRRCPPPTGKEDGVVDGVALHDDVRWQPSPGLAHDHVDAFGRGRDGRVKEQRVLADADQRHARVDVGGRDERCVYVRIKGGKTESYRIDCLDLIN